MAAKGLNVAVATQDDQPAPGLYVHPGAVSLGQGGTETVFVCQRRWVSCIIKFLLRYDILNIHLSNEKTLVTLGL